jgi:DNA end-binding protein Ku
MAARATSSTTISFGLVSIPVKVYTATSEQGVHFHQLHEKCGGRIKQRLYCPTDDEFVERTDLVKGYEVAKNQYVQFSEEELHALDAERFSTLDLVEFVPESTVDFVYIERSHYLGPDKGGEKAFNLLSRAMRKMERIAVGKQWSRGKVNLVLLRPYKKGLILHHVYYANEVRAYDDVELGPDVRFSEAEDELAGRLIEQLSQPSFEPERFEDEYAGRVAKAAAEKAEGQQITVAPEQPAAQIIDLFEALKQSLNQPAPVRQPVKKVASGGGGDVEEEAEDSGSMKGPRKAPARPKKSGGQKKLG